MDILSLLPPRGQALPLVVFAGAHLGRGTYTVLDGWPVFPALYLFIIGEGAAAALSEAEAYFSPAAIEPLPRRVGGIGSPASLVYLVRDALRRPEAVRKRVRHGRVDTYSPAGCAVTLADPGAGDGRVVLVDRNLAARLSQRTAGARSMQAALMAGWWGDALSAPLPFRDGSRLEACSAHIAALLVSTSAAFRELPEQFRSVVMVSELPARAERFGSQVQRTWEEQATIGCALTYPPASPVPVDEAAARLLEKASRGMGRHRSEALVHLTKLALVVAVLDLSVRIACRHVEVAIATLRASRATEARILAGGGPSRLALRIDDFLRSRPAGLPRAALNRLLGGRHSSAEITAALQELALRGWAQSERRFTPGRTAEFWLATGDWE